ncbi:MAG TPA: hypothetical protein VFE47_27910 [Tepidisphaeraceae bacterium]|jgi:hypothetical protein|nr:hypothetical protein [Tepidisphaeraceae bacterium]
MVDRLISRGLSIMVMGLITLTFGGAVLLAYRALFELLAAQFTDGAWRFAAVIPLALAARLLIRHKDDLMDR